MTEKQHQLLRIAALELKKEEEARDAFLNAPSGPSTPQCFSTKRILRFIKGKAPWNAKEQEHLKACSYCRLFVRDYQRRVEITENNKQNRGFSFSLPSFSRSGKVCFAAASFILIVFVASNVIRPNANKSQFPSIDQLEKNGEYLFDDNIRSTNSNGTVLISPKATAVRKNRPVFQWKNTEQSKLILQVYRISASEKKLYVTQPVNGGSWIPNQDFPPGVYYWKLNDKPSKVATFRVLAATETVEIAEQEKILKSDSELATLYLRHQLFAEAKPILQRLYSKNKEKNLIPYLKIVANSG